MVSVLYKRFDAINNFFFHILSIAFLIVKCLYASLEKVRSEVDDVFKVYGLGRNY